MSIGSMLPAALHAELSKNFEEGLEEVRLRAGRHAEFIYGDRIEQSMCRVTQQQISETLNYLSGYSLYRLEENLKKGFFTAKGGHRVGVVGRTSRTAHAGGSGISGISDIGGMNIRVAHEKKGCARGLLPYIRDGDVIYNTLLAAPPGAGKTTYLRDMIRLLSTGDENYAGLRVSVVDERSELAACYLGVAQNDLGPRTDVLDDCPKEAGMRMLLRSMSPQVIAVDELGGSGEGEAALQMIYSGSRLLGTVHAGSVDELCRNACTRKLLAQEKIGRMLLLKKAPDGRRSCEVYDGRKKRLC